MSMCPRFLVCCISFPTHRSIPSSLPLTSSHILSHVPRLIFAGSSSPAWALGSAPAPRKAPAVRPRPAAEPPRAKPAELPGTPRTRVGADRRIDIEVPWRKSSAWDGVIPGSGVSLLMEKVCVLCVVDHCANIGGVSLSWCKARCIVPLLICFTPQAVVQFW